MARTELEVRRVGPGETAAVAAPLARAFEHDRVMRWLAPGHGRLERGFALYLERLWLVHDSCFTTDDRLAAACGRPPERWRLSAGQRVRLLPRLAAVMGRDLPRFATGVRAIEGRHPAATRIEPPPTSRPAVTQELRLPGGGPPLWPM